MSRRLALLAPSLLCIVLLASSCGDEERPELNSLSLRELFGLSTERFAALDASEQARIVERVVEKWEQEVERSTPDAKIELNTAGTATLDAPTAPPLDFVRDYDQQLSRDGEEMTVAGTIHPVSFREARLRPLSVPMRELGLHPSSGFVVEPLREPLPFDGVLFYDEAWGQASEERLGGRSERDAVESLEPTARRFLSLMGLREESAQIVRAPRAPVVMWYSEPHRALLVNPNFLVLLRPAPPTTRFPSSHASALEEVPDFIQECVFEQIDRCEMCFGTFGDEHAMGCETPLLDGALSPRGECSAFAEGAARGFHLYCYNRFINNNIGCFHQSGVGFQCGTSGVPYTSLEGLEALSPFLDSDHCVEALQECEEGRVVEARPLPEPPPSTTPSSASDGDDASVCGDVFVALCDAGLACDSEDDGGSDSGGGCEGDDDSDSGCGGDDDSGGLCEGDDMSATIVRPTRNPKELLIALPFLFLAWVWWGESSYRG